MRELERGDPDRCLISPQVAEGLFDKEGEVHTHTFTSHTYSDTLKQMHTYTQSKTLHNISYLNGSEGIMVKRWLHFKLGFVIGFVLANV